MDEKLRKLKRAECAKLLNRGGFLDYDTYKKFVKEYSDFVYDRSKEIGKKHGKAPVIISFAMFDRMGMNGVYSKEEAVEELFPEMLKEYTARFVLAQLRIRNQSRHEVSSEAQELIELIKKKGEEKKTDLIPLI